MRTYGVYYIPLQLNFSQDLYPAIVNHKRPKYLVPDAWINQKDCLIQLYERASQVGCWVKEYLKAKAKWLYYYRVANSYATLFGASTEWSFSYHALDDVLNLTPASRWKIQVTRDSSRK